jgi:hypothetical protein
MAKAKGEVSVEADGKRYTLVYSVNAICKMEDELGDAVKSIGSLAVGGKKFSTVRTVFWCGLLDNHPDLTIQDAGRIIDAIGFDKADAVVGEAFSLAFPEVKRVPLEMPKPAQTRRGRTG